MQPLHLAKVFCKPQEPPNHTTDPMGTICIQKSPSQRPYDVAAETQATGIP